MTVRFSVIIPSRDRPTLLERAIESVLLQSHPDKEVVVVDDGTSGNNRQQYDVLEQRFAGQVRFHHLVHRPKGHGPSYAINFGVSNSGGTYVCFLDDDDSWIDPDHLARTNEVIESADKPVDLYLSNQHAFLRDARVDRRIWVEGLIDILKKNGQPDACGAYDTTVEDLMQCGGFSHYNTLIVRRDLYLQVGGMDETIRWEGDRDLFLRLIDRADLIKHHPAVVSRHNIPDPKKRDNETTMTDELNKRLFQLNVLDKALLFSKHPAIRDHAGRHKSYALKKIAGELRKNGDYRRAFYYAREALMVGFSFKWTLFTAYIFLRNIFGGRDRLR